MKNDYLSSTIFVPLIQQTDSSKSNQSTKSDSYDIRGIFFPNIIDIFLITKPLSGSETQPIFFGDISYTKSFQLHFITRNYRGSIWSRN